MSKTIEVRKKGCPKFSFFHQKNGLGHSNGHPYFEIFPIVLGLFFGTWSQVTACFPAKYSTASRFFSMPPGRPMNSKVTNLKRTAGAPMNASRWRVSFNCRAQTS